MHWANLVSLLLLVHVLSSNEQDSERSPEGTVQTNTFDYRPPSRYVGLQGETSHFPCFPEYAGHSEASVTWELPDKVTRLTQEQFLEKASGIFIMKNNTLVLQHLSDTHRGVFWCRLLYKDVHVETAMHVVVVQADLQSMALRLVVGAGSIAGFLHIYGLLYLAYKMYVCWGSCYRRPEPDLHTIPLRRV